MIWAASVAGLVLFGLALAWPFIVESRRAPPDGIWKSDAPGNFAGLSGGATHYRVRGPQRGQWAVCIHGLTTPSTVFDAIADDLAHMGFRVLTYDLFGRGFSDSASDPQTPAHFYLQLEELLEAVGVTGDILLVGYSMGGQIATDFAAHAPDRVDRVVLLAPAGLDYTPDAAMTRLRDSGLRGDAMMRVTGARLLGSVAEAQRVLPSQVDGIVDDQLRQLTRQGYLPAVLSSMRHTLTQDQFDAHVGLGRIKMPVLAVWGEDDTVIPLSAKDRLATANPDARQVILEGAGHSLAFTHTPQIRDAVQAFLKTVVF